MFEAIFSCYYKGYGNQEEEACSTIPTYCIQSIYIGDFYSEILEGVMDFHLHLNLSLRESSYNVLVAPREHFIAMLNRNLNLQLFKVLFVIGNYSGILSRLHRRFTELEIRGASPHFN